MSLTFGSLAMIVAVWWYYKVQSGETEDATTRQLYAVAHGKTDQIANWRHERVGDGRVAMTSPVMRVLKRSLASRVMNADDRADVLDLMTRMASQGLYSDVTLVDLDGNVALSLKEETTEGAEFRKRSRGALAREAAKASDVVLSDLHPDTRIGRPLMALTVPVGDLGALILDIDPSVFLYPYLESWPGSSRSAETLLIRLEGNELVYLSKMRTAPQITLFAHRPVTLKAPSDEVLDSGWSLRAPDPRGVSSLWTIRRIADSPWYLVCKMDIAEVDAPLRRLGWEMALVTALIGLANAAGIGLIWRGQESRIHHEREAWYQAIANDTPAYLWMASAGEENSFINQPLGRFLGTDQQKLTKAWSDYVHPADKGRTRTAFLDCLAAGRGYTSEFRICRFDGAYRWVIAEAVPRFSPGVSFWASPVPCSTSRTAGTPRISSAPPTPHWLAS